MKDFFLTDKEIQNLINEPKKINCSPHSILSGMKIKTSGHSAIRETTHSFQRNNTEDVWYIYIRLNEKNRFDFSCGLGFIPKGRKEVFRLLRYNGKSHKHTNRLDGKQPFYDFHIHKATEKYQKSSYKDDHYATPTDRYAQLDDAFKCLLKDCNIVIDTKDTKQMEMF